MHKLYVATLIIVFSVIFGLAASSVHGSGGGVVLYQIQAGAVSGELAATQEFVSIYNNSDQTIDVSNWCITNKNSTFVCFTPLATNELLQLPTHQYATISSDTFALANSIKPDLEYTTTNRTSGSIVAGSDIIQLVDANGEIKDEISWTKSLTGGSLLQRSVDALIVDTYIDTGLPTDFQKLNELNIPASGLEELIIPDSCININGIQDSIPEGYIANDLGQCSLIPVDICQNINEIQIELPDGYGLDSSSNCLPDVCLNILEVQFAVPDGYKQHELTKCVLIVLPIKLSEILPNPIGSDDDNEFIEIFNPNETDVDLSQYLIIVGTDSANSYDFPLGSFIKAGQYRSFSNDEIKFTLLNTASKVQIISVNNELIDETPEYINPESGSSWAVINDVWQYTNRPTIGSLNLISLIEPADIDEVDITLTPCAANQYRNLETGRCRLLVTLQPALVPCKDGQYRSEETNRCRNIVSDVASLTQCAEGQERNPETNRCRSISAVLGTSVLTPCKEGQERNSETNRCRNVVVIPKASYAPEKTGQASSDNSMWYVIGAVGAVALIYGIWEWRREFVKFYKILAKLFVTKK